MTTLDSDAVGLKPHAPNLCSSCDKVTSSFCSGCRNIKYCSQECQKQDWKLHRSVCKSFTNLEERPGFDYFRALFFPVKELVPRFIWIKDREYLLDEEMEELIGHKGMKFETTEFDCDREKERSLGHKIELIYNAYFRADGSPPNEAIQALKGIRYGQCWKGGFLARGYTKNESYRNQQNDEFVDVDLDTKSLGPIVNFLNSRAGGQFAMDMMEQQNAEKK